MAGLLVLAVIGAYLFVSILLIYGAAKVARNKGINPWLPGITAALIMYLLVFWDHVPVLIKHHNLCKEQSGFWIYKTPEQWFKENPGTIGKKWGDEWNDLRYENVNGISRSWLSDYVYLETSYNQKFAHAIRRYESRLIDARTHEVLAKMVNFERGGGNPMLRADSLTDYKFWLGMGNNNCSVNGFGKIVQKFKYIGRIEK